MIWTKYGSPEVLKLQEVDKPVPGENDLLINIKAASLTLGDCEMRNLKLPLVFRIPLRFFIGLFKPKRIRILGQEFSGIVESVGKKVTGFHQGDKVFATTGITLGAHAEYICISQDRDEGALALKPVNLTFEQAAVVPFGALESLHFLRKAAMKKGSKILINGAGGSIGTYAVQLAKYFGAHVTVVDTGDKLEMLKSLGADETIDFRQQDFTLAGKQYDIIFDIVGKSNFGRSLKCLNENGYYLIANPNFKFMIKTLASKLLTSGNKKIVIGAASQNSGDLDYVKDLVESGILKPVIDKEFNLEQLPEAHRYVESGMKKGNVVIKIN